MRGLGRAAFQFAAARGKPTRNRPVGGRFGKLPLQSEDRRQVSVGQIVLVGRKRVVRGVQLRVAEVAPDGNYQFTIDGTSTVVAKDGTTGPAPGGSAARKGPQRAAKKFLEVLARVGATTGQAVTRASDSSDLA